MLVRCTLRALIISSCLSATNALAVEAPSGEELGGLEEQPFELGRLEVVGQDFSFEQELQIRLIRQALKNQRSDDRDKVDEWVCWYEAEGASRIRRLKCARNGDLWALRPVQLAPGGLANGNVLTSGALGTSARGYGTIWVAKFTSRQKQFEQTLDRLPGSDDFDREFIAMAGQGERPPRDIPTEAEFDAFAAAYLEVERLQEAGADDTLMETAIRERGLEVVRYNRIVELIEIYQSLMNEVAQRIGRMPGDAPEA